MAGIAAAAIAAEQVIATGVEAAAAVAIAAPTLPLKISLTHLANPAPKPSPHPPLTRSHHTLTVLSHNKAFLFGGRDPSSNNNNNNNTLCPPAVHTLTLPTAQSTPDAPAAARYTPAYTCYPPYPLHDAATGDVLVPSAREVHAACAWGDRYLLVHGGRGEGGKAVEEGGCLWRWDCEGLCWGRLRGDSQLGVGMAARWGHWMFADGAQGFLVVVGGRRTTTTTAGDGGGEEEGEDVVEREAWMYDFHAMVWTALPRLPARPLAAAYVDGRVYVIGSVGQGSAGLGGVVHYLDMRDSTTEREKPGALVWESVTFPANPLAPGPTPREGGALVPLTTSYGRAYLVYLFGCSGEGGGRYYSDIWTLQVPSHGRTAAAVKDKIRDNLPGMESGEFRWAEAEIIPTEQMTEEGKVHPGPRALFGADRCLDGQGIVLWGGANAKGETEGDGWLLRLAHGYADNDRWE